MPRTSTRRNQSKFKKRKAVKRINDTNTKNIVRLTKSIGGFPDTLVTKLRYSTVITLDPNVGIPATKAFFANSVFDPQNSVLGHQPYMHDVYSQVYKRYVVTGSKITVQPLPTATTNIVPGTFGVTLSKEVVLPFVSVNTFMESDNRSTTTAVYGNASATASSTNPIIRNQFSARKFFGVKDISDGGIYEGATGDVGTGTNPGRQAWYILWAIDNNGNNPGSYSYRVTIDYIVRYKEYKLQMAS